MTLLTGSAFFLLQAAPATGRSPMIGFYIQIVAIVAIFYFLLWRPRQKQQKQHEERLKELRKGDSVVTTGGIVGEVVHIKESVTTDGPKKTMDDLITIKSGESRLVVMRGRVERVVGGAGAAEDKA